MVYNFAGGVYGVQGLFQKLEISMLAKEQFAS